LPVFADAVEAERLTQAIEALHVASDYTLLAATVMPDHAHLLFQLGHRLTLGQVIAKLKSRARKNGGARWRWQDDGFERRLRADESAEDYAFYVFMNPYRAKLASLDTRWPWWRCSDERSFRFLCGLNGGPVPRQWLDDVERVASTIFAGE
jgi:REP element-mobilizing transposase RayT